MRNHLHHRVRGTAALCGAALLLATSACSGDGDGPGTEVVTQVRVVETVEDFAYYNPCANEPVQVGQQTFYPLLQDEIADLDRELYVAEEQGSPLTGMLRVAPPGPGDDVGTMTLYEDGVARYVADSGDESWFDDQERTYNWVC